MKKKEIQELKNRPTEELARLVVEGSEKLRTLRFDLAKGKVKDISEIHEAKKKIARMKTFIHQNERAK
jgi:large subunit ribosomal protein L29